jgi:hypothetical protein
MYRQLMPGETQEETEHEFYEWLRRLVECVPDVFLSPPEVTRLLRWLPDSGIPASTPVVSETLELR